ncbi:class I SAM-dependent methyltransferase [Marinicella sediminis]|uniref:Class I SAM-dependent methyltransferase n=1 Tax=Marinicella sediminis TaxID=1792834 RepID=A0ABV7JA84_9GAMM|nr:class I SAM-dependent methyltransferase [Marinicella sediminis]
MHYRSYIGKPDGYDILAANQFEVLNHLGLREFHKILDLGCGSLRLGRILIPYLLKHGYFGVEPNIQLIMDGVENELGWDAIKIKQPQFLPVEDFSLWRLATQFDFVIAHSIFTHTYPELAVHALQNVKQVLAPRGLLVCTFIEVDKQPFYSKEGWEYPVCLGYTKEVIHSFFDKAGFKGEPLNFPNPCQSWWLGYN